MRQRLQTNLWTAPGLAVVGALLLSSGLARVDRSIAGDQSAWYLYAGRADSAREILSTIASSMLTFTALVFSITILVLQLASSQFSPRVIRTFLQDRQTRVTLATFVGSFVYAMALMPEVLDGPDDEGGFVPALSVFVAFLLVLFSIAVFIRYVHHMAHSIRAVEVIRRIGDETRGSLRLMFPEGTLDDTVPDAALALPEADRALPNDGPAGIVTHVDTEGLLEIACARDVTLAVVPFVGDFVPQGAALFRIWGAAELTTQELHRHVVIAEERTVDQDPAFGFRQLVDIAERALSPGINDPTTAVQALDQLHDLLRMLARRPFPSAARKDDAGKVRLVLPAPDWEGYVRLALDEIRQYGEGSIQVTRRLKALLEDLTALAPASRQEILREELRLLEASIQRGFETQPERELARSGSIRGQVPRDR